MKLVVAIIFVSIKKLHCYNVIEWMQFKKYNKEFAHEEVSNMHTAQAQLRREGGHA